MKYNHIKRALDFIFSLFALIILTPISLMIAMLILLDTKGPVLFKQERIGRHKKHFWIYKFRTMRINTPKNTPTHELGDPQKWITPVGKFLRKSSLDEIPQILNILKGEMSIIGPRPALWNQFDLIVERDKYDVHELLPGLTGYAQINGRDELGIIDKAKLDGYYVNNICLSLDIKIFFMTIVKVFKSDGIKEGTTSQSGTKTETKTDFKENT